VQVARRFDGEIISGDSRQVYRDMTIGTGKDLEEYGDVPYHLLDIKPAGYKYNLHEFLDDFRHARELIVAKGRMPILCGGTGMYVEAALSGISLPEVPCNTELRERLAPLSLPQLTEILQQYKRLHNTTDVDTAQRAIRAIEIEEYYQHHPEQKLSADRSKTTPLPAIIIGMDIPREDRRRRITARLHQRLDDGMVDEVKGILDRGVAPDDLIYYGLEYKFITLYLIGELSYDDMVSQLEIAIHQFAKRQMTWFRGMERRGFKINWLPYDLEQESFLARVAELIQK
jgi:tRNA dimethylallyltransferase